MEAGTAETFEFKAEVSRVMDIIINSLYSEKDVFLRELVSNAADACDKKRFLAITDSKGSADDLNIKIKGDKEKKVLVIEDSGVGMTKEEMKTNLGSIAQSGTKKFEEMVKAKEQAKDDMQLIGQFGVGFYSGFLVADKITVYSKGLNGDDGKTFKWSSEAGSGYTIAEVDGEEAIAGESGTRIVLQLREDCEEYTDPFKLKTLVTRYSQFINFPINIWSTKTTYEQVDDEEANKDLQEGEEPKKKTIPVDTEDWELQNSQTPLWMRSPSEVSAEEYEEFYKGTFKAFDKPLTLSHFALEGQVEFRALLFVPGMLPFDLGSNMFDEDVGNMRLYVRRVFINDKFTELCPRWLKFVKGVIDSEDLPLNVGREILQKSSVLRVVSRRIINKSLAMFEDLKDKGGDDWNTFQKSFGKYLKVGVVEDKDNREEIAEYITFLSSHHQSNLTSISEYVGRMKEGQECVYYISGEGRAQCEISPALDKVKEKGYEVMFCTEPLDELCMMELKEVEGKPLVDLSKDEVQGIDDQEDQKEQKDQLVKDFNQTLIYLKEVIGQQIEKAEVTVSLTDSPANLAQGKFSMSPQMQKYMKARAVAMGGAGMPSVLQINPEHPIVAKLNKQLQDGTKDDTTERTAQLLYHVAALRGGYEINDPKQFASLVTELMAD